ncbi:MAG: hypothetical protein KC421_18875 [Anaerolineales bacterium]|nr:hypothetical protein [Anaerolineales bacterium]
MEIGDFLVSNLHPPFSMKYQHTHLIGFVLLLGLLSLACSVPFLGPEEPPATPTPMGDTLQYKIPAPAYVYNLAPGESVPGTRLEYVGKNGDAYDVRIDGLAATKRIGDSFIWSGTVAPGVSANYNLKLTTEVLGKLPVAGSVDLLIFNPAPIEVSTVPVESALLNYRLISTNYQMPPGAGIPGTTLTYVGTTTQAGSEVAELSGLTGYPYLARGDSLAWTGKLLNNVYVRYDWRVLDINEFGLDLTGTAELWITP